MSYIQTQRLENQKGRMYPVARGSKVKSKSIQAVPSRSGMGAWHLLADGTKVYVLYKENRPIMWLNEAETKQEKDLAKIVEERFSN